ncbi:alpha-2-macroglobulin family protein [Pacificibacter marinus]|uniref:alpha-2-macroglobulin family protein n=1 Tax=Pacificibacter marinus TaxID=658057 RepID=UPI001C07ACB2|nr:alpha-2-macroglobulin family protein [Pacificibacter marinus]MBU2868040.1 alpha-2-macroglobulin family protein [Pacificibacter marinus]
MRRIFAALIVLLTFASAGFAQSPLPEQQLLNTRNVDFYGADLKSIFDTTLDTCQRACLNDAQCNAFTFNRRSASCFLKSAVGEQTVYDGAISGELRRVPQARHELAKLRAGELDWLRAGDFDAARRQTQMLGAQTYAGSWKLNDAREAYASKLFYDDKISAFNWLGVALALSDEPDMWIDYARLSQQAYHLMVQNKHPADSRRTARNAILPSAINAYLRQTTDQGRAAALVFLSQALEMNDRGREQISTLRLAQRLAPNSSTAEQLARAERLYGFRIIDSDVDSDIALSRVCVEFSESLASAGVDYSNYVSLPDTATNAGFAVTAEGRSLCIEGVAHGARYAFTFRKGLPEENGEKLARDVPLEVYVRDRSPSVQFPGRAYVLPRMPEAGLPVETVNLDHLDLSLYQISDRTLISAIREEHFGRALSGYREKDFRNNFANVIWQGEADVQNTLNKTMVTRLPFDGPMKDLAPGIYALAATVPDDDRDYSQSALQWFVVSDLGLTSFLGTDGLHVYVRGLNDAKPKAGVTVELLSRANRVLATTETDVEGHALFEAGLTHGTDSAAPAMLLAQTGTKDAPEDMVFLSLTDPAFDLSDRGVEGMPPAPPIDAFLATDRDAYRPGETIHATVLLRDTNAAALSGLPLTAILTRPDGVEYSRVLSSGDVAGGHVFDLPLGTSVARGTWRLELRSDLEAPALTSASLLVEGFLPERIDFSLSLPDGPIRAGDTPPLTVDAHYLFGAPASELGVEGTVRLSQAKGLEAWPKYHFGRYDEPLSSVMHGFGNGVTTDAQGQATVPLELPDLTANGHLVEATIVARVAEGSGRPVERKMTRMLALDTPVIGLRPEFDGLVGEGETARFKVVGLAQDAAPAPMDIHWTLNRLERHYQWYQADGRWDWDVTTTRTPIATGDLTTDTDPIALEAQVDWGEYEMVVERTDGEYVATSYAFSAGWYVPAGADSPDTLDMSLDAKTYDVGDTAKLRLVSRYDGTAFIAVMSNHLIATQSVAVEKGENLIPVDVTEDWGTGAYVTVQAIRPMDGGAKVGPARALGLVYAKIEPGKRALTVSLDTDEVIDPRGPLPVTVNVEGATGPAYVTVAAVDLGVLNLTGFDSPSPSQHYFGQRRLGVEIRDVYGRLIDGMNGAMGQIRSGGDATGGLQRQAPPPTEELVAYFSGPVEIGADGTAQVSFNIPSFNGTVRLMAVAWSDEAVGEAERDVIVRDPVVVTASLPRFLAPDDTTQMLLEFVHTEGPAGDMPLTIEAAGLDLGTDIPATISLTEKGKTALRVPVSARISGDYEMTVTLTTPAGKALTKTLHVPVRVNDPQVSQTRRFELAAGDTFSLTRDVFTGLREGTGSALISAGSLAQLNVPALMRDLDRYPYGCTEQLTSRAIPLLYFDEVADAIGMTQTQDVDDRLEQAVKRILTRQNSSGAFGLWQPEGGDFWLDSYVSDFLSRAKLQGVDVPDNAFRTAMDNLRNEISYASDFEVDRNGGGVALAYGLMVLAREGAARIGDLRYYADEKAEDFATPLAQAQLGAALAFYGDQLRADRLFTLANRNIMRLAKDSERGVWRDDYGSTLRDAAAILSLATEAGSNAVDREALTRMISRHDGPRSTQEMAWGLLAAHSLIDDPRTDGLTVNGASMSGGFVQRVVDGADLSPLEVRNTSAEDADITLTTFGVPIGSVEADGYGYTMTRRYFTPEGTAIEGPVEQGTRLVVVLDVTPSDDLSGRLMIDDPLPAGLEIDNPHLISSGDMTMMPWLKTSYAEHAEFRSDRFLAQVSRQDGQPIRLAYVVRAITPGDYHHPAASVTDMYRPQYNANTASGRFIVTP